MDTELWNSLLELSENWVKDSKTFQNTMASFIYATSCDSDMSLEGWGNNLSVLNKE